MCNVRRYLFWNADKITAIFSHKITDILLPEKYAKEEMNESK